MPQFIFYIDNMAALMIYRWVIVSLQRRETCAYNFFKENLDFWDGIDVICLMINLFLFLYLLYFIHFRAGVGSQRRSFDSMVGCSHICCPQASFLYQYLFLSYKNQ